MGAEEWLPERRTLPALREAAEDCRGPAGTMLDKAMGAAGIDWRRVYLTNAVKHFKFTRKEVHLRRLHKPPTAAEVRACGDVMATVHPASVLRARKPDWERVRKEFYDDVERAAEYLGKD